MVSSTTIEVTDADDARKILRIMDALEDNDDVQDVYSNFDISDELMESGAGDVSCRIGDRAPDVHPAAARAAASYSLSDYPGAAGRARVLPGRRHPRVHQAAQQLQRRLRPVRRRRRTGAGDLRAERRAATRSSPASTASQFPLLADPDKAVAGLYGTLGPLGFPRRSVFVVDGDGIIRYAHRAIAGLTFRPVDELVDVLLGLPR